MKNPDTLKDYTIHGTGDCPLHVYNQYYTDRILSVYYHWHKEIELIYVEKDPVDIIVNGIPCQVKDGDFICINSEELHQLHSVGNLPSIHHALVFLPDILQFEYPDAAQTHYIYPLINQSLILPRIIPSDAIYGEKIRTAFLEILRLFESRTPGWYLGVKSCIYQILTILICENLLIAEPGIHHPDYKTALVKKSMQYIHEHYQQKIYLEELAANVSMNTQYFCRFFKSIVGKTPVAYINHYRITQAARLLQSENISVTEAGLRTGFENPSYFIKLFKAQSQMTPSDYKKLFY